MIINIASGLIVTLELRTFLYTFVYGDVVFDIDARNVKHKLQYRKVCVYLRVLGKIKFAVGYLIFNSEF